MTSIIIIINLKTGTCQTKTVKSKTGTRSIQANLNFICKLPLAICQSIFQHYVEKNVVLVLVLILVSYLFGDFQGHDGGSLSVGQWVAVAYNEGFFIGKITAINMGVLDETVEGIDVNFLTKTTKGNYKWPKRKDTDIVGTTYIFLSTPTVNEDGKNFVVNNEDNISKHYESYKKAYMIN